MCGMNLAFNRELIGPAMYFGLMGEGYPIGRYDDMWAGWCVKVNSDCQNIVVRCSLSPQQLLQTVYHVICLPVHLCCCWLWNVSAHSVVTST